jgi:hypothetical protein
VPRPNTVGEVLLLMRDRVAERENCGCWKKVQEWVTENLLVLRREREPSLAQRTLTRKVESSDALSTCSEKHGLDPVADEKLQRKQKPESRRVPMA